MTTYLGRACKTCFATEKYISTRGCVLCHKRKALNRKYKDKIFTNIILTEKERETLDRKEAKEKGHLYPPDRQKAKEDGKKYYLGKACGTCGLYRRYVKTNGCVVCASRQGREYYERKVQKQKTT